MSEPVRTEVIWEREDASGPIRAVIVDEETVAPIPRKVILEQGVKNTIGDFNWTPLYDKWKVGPNNLECVLAYELGKAEGTLPEWAL